VEFRPNVCPALTSFPSGYRLHRQFGVRWILKARPHCRRKVRQSPNFAVVSPFSATVALFCDSLTFLRQCGQGFRGYTFWTRCSDILSPFKLPMWRHSWN